MAGEPGSGAAAHAYAVRGACRAHPAWDATTCRAIPRLLPTCGRSLRPAAEQRSRTPGVSLNPGRIGFLQIVEMFGAEVSAEVTGAIHGDPIGTVTVRGRGLFGTRGLRASWRLPPSTSCRSWPCSVRSPRASRR